MSKLKRTAIIGLLFVSAQLVGCSGLISTTLPTPYPTEHIPTVIAMTLAAQGINLEPDKPPAESTTGVPSPTATEEPTQTSLPSPTPVQSTVTPTAVPSPLPGEQEPLSTSDLPLSPIQILSPGSGSKVVSPFILRAALNPGDNSTIRIELFGEDGQLLMREIRTYQSLETDWLSLGSEIAYGINSVAEPGRLQISIEDQHGRLKSVSSKDLLLQSMGNQDLNHPQDQLEDIILESPRPNLLIQGGTMRVAGKARPYSNQPFRIEIITSDGRIVGTRQVSVNPAANNQYGTFAIDVPYSITGTNRVRVQVWEPGSLIPGIINLSSVEVLIGP